MNVVSGCPPRRQRREERRWDDGATLLQSNLGQHGREALGASPPRHDLRGLRVDRDRLATVGGGDRDGFTWEQHVGEEGRAGQRSARAAVAGGGAGRRSGHRHFDRAAEAARLKLPPPQKLEARRTEISALSRAFESKAADALVANRKTHGDLLARFLDR